MKRYILLIILIISLFGMGWAVGKRQPASDKKNASVIFNGKTFYLQYSVGSKQAWLNEYLPAGQNFDNYTEMIAIRSYDSIQATPLQIAQIIANNYQRDYPGIKFLLASNEKTGDGIVSFIMLNKNVFEHNLFRTTTKNEVPVSVQYVFRKHFPQGYSKEDLVSSGKEFKQHRNGWINALDKMTVPDMVRTVKE